MVGFFPFHVGLDYNKYIVYIYTCIMSEKTLEHFQQKVDTIKWELDKIKKETTDSDLEKKKTDIDKKIFAANEAIDDELSDLKKNADKNKSLIAKLEELKKTLATFAPELANLKKEVLDTITKESKEEWKPSLFAKIVYGGILWNVASKIPLIWDSLKEWADGKLKESAEDNLKEKAKPEHEKSGFWSNAWKWIGGAALLGGAVAIANKSSWSTGSFWDTVKSWFSSDKKEETQSSTPSVTPTPETPQDWKPLTPETPWENNSTTEVANAPLTEEEQKANETVKELYNAGHSYLYIVFRMYQLGFVPKYDWAWKGASVMWKIWYLANMGPFVKILDKMWPMRKNFNYWMNDAITKNREVLIKAKLEVIKTSPWLQSVYDQRINSLSQMQKDIASNSYNPRDFEKKYSAEIKEFSTRDPQKLKTQLQEKFTNLSEVKKDIKNLESNISKLKSEAQKKLQDLNTKAKNYPKDLKKYKAEANKVIAEYNLQIAQAEKQMGIRSSWLSTQEQITSLSKESPYFKKLIDINGGVSKYFDSTRLGKGVAKTWKFMIWVSVVSLLTKWISDNTAQWWAEVGLQGADLALWMVPYGGVYDVSTAISGKWFAGQLSTTDRWIRWVVGWASLVLDLAWTITSVTWIGAVAGLGGSAVLKWLGRSVVAIPKAVKIMKVAKTTAEVIQTGYKLWSFWYLGYVFYDETKPIVVSLFETIDHKTESDIPLTI